MFRMSCRVVSVHVLRVDGSGVPVVVASSKPTEESLESCSSSSSSSFNLTNDQVSEVIRHRVRLHFNNTGRVELEGGNIVFRVTLLDDLTLCLVAITEDNLLFSTALDFINLIQEAITCDTHWMESFCRGEPLEEAMEATLTQFVMTENGKEHAQSAKMNNLQRQVDDVKTVMSNNVQMIMERGERLENIQERSDNLAASSESFKMTARRVQRKFCMLNAKWTIIASIGVILLVTVIILIILSAAGVFKK